MTNDKREALIEEADAMYDAVGVRIFREEFREWYLSSFEQAHTPTDDERIVRASIHGDVDAIRALDRLLRRRPVQGEPTAEVPDLSTEASRALAKIREASQADLGWVDFGRRVDEILAEHTVAEPVPGTTNTASEPKP